MKVSFNRNVKPANLVITKHDMVKIFDFGLAKLTGEHAFWAILNRQSRLLSYKQALKSLADLDEIVWGKDLWWPVFERIG